MLSLLRLQNLSDEEIYLDETSICIAEFVCSEDIFSIPDTHRHQNLCSEETLLAAASSNYPLYAQP